MWQAAAGWHGFSAHSSTSAQGMESSDRDPVPLHDLAGTGHPAPTGAVAAVSGVAGQALAGGEAPGAGQAARAVPWRAGVAPVLAGIGQGCGDVWLRGCWG